MTSPFCDQDSDLDAMETDHDLREWLYGTCDCGVCVCSSPLGPLDYPYTTCADCAQGAHQF